MILLKASSLKIKSGPARRKRKSSSGGSGDSAPVKVSWAAVVPSKNPAPPGPPAVPGPPTPSSQTATYSPPQGQASQRQPQRPVPPPTYNPPPTIQTLTQTPQYRSSHLASPSMTTPQMMPPTQGYVQPPQQQPSRNAMHLLQPQQQQRGSPQQQHSMYAPPLPQSQTHFSAFTSSPRGNVPPPIQSPGPPHQNGSNVGANQQGPPPRFIHYHQSSSSNSPAPTAPPLQGPSAINKGKTKGAGPSATMGVSSAESGGKLQNPPVAGGPSNGAPGSGPGVSTGSVGSRPGSSAGASTGSGQYGTYS
jgi:hypothetical protein